MKKLIIVLCVLILSTCLFGCDQESYREWRIDSISCKSNSNQSCILKLEKEGWHPRFIKVSAGNLYVVGQKVVVYTNTAGGKIIYIGKQVYTRTATKSQVQVQTVYINPDNDTKALVMKNGKKIQTLEKKVYEIEKK